MLKQEFIRIKIASQHLFLMNNGAKILKQEIFHNKTKALSQTIKQI